MTGRMMGIERFSDKNDHLLAIVVRASCRVEGIHFVTDDEATQQLGVMHHAAGHRVGPHVHHSVPRTVELTQETLFIRSGCVRLDLYTVEQDYVTSCVLKAGDVVLLISGGHGLEVLEDADIVEVKQGPFVGDRDKTRFDPVRRTRDGKG
jgi:hypothetical protein